MLNETEFALLAREVKARSGAVLNRELMPVMEMRLTPIARREGFAAIADMIAAARIRSDGTLWAAMAEALALCETRFFRDRAHFTHLREQILPRAMKRRGHERVRIWSAACATGQEPYSIAMIIEDMREMGLNPAVEITATDFSERLIDKARSGLYTQFEVQRGLPIRKLISHFEKAGDLWRLSDRIRASVRFEPHNLLKHPGHLGQFDIIVLAHVLSSFDAETRAAVLNRVAAQLSPSGVILLGEGEPMPEGLTNLQFENGMVTRLAPSQIEAA